MSISSILKAMSRVKCLFVLMVIIFSGVKASAGSPGQRCHQIFSVNNELVQKTKSPLEVSSILSQSDRAQGPTLEIKPGLELIDTYSSDGLGGNLIFLILKAQVSTPSAIRKFLAGVEELVASRGIMWREDLTYFRKDPNSQLQNLEIPIGGDQSKVSGFLEDLNLKNNQDFNTTNGLSVEIVNLGKAQPHRPSPIIIGHGQLSISGHPSKMEKEAMETLSRAAELIAKERFSVPILQLGLSKELSGYSPFIVMVPMVEGMREAVQSGDKVVVDVKGGLEEVSQNWIKHFLKIAKGRVIYSVKSASSQYYLMNGDNYSRVDADLVARSQSVGTNDSTNGFPAELLSMIKTCLGCETVKDNKSTGALSGNIKYVDPTKGSRNVNTKNINPLILNKMQRAADKDGAKFALRDSFPREMNTMGARLDEIVLRILERSGATKEEITSFFKELESWQADYHLEIFQWGLKRDGSCRNFYTCYMMLKVIESLGTVYNMKDIGLEVDIQSLHTYDGMRAFLDNLGFPKIHDGQRVITSKVLIDLQRVIDSQLALEPLIGKYSQNPRAKSLEERRLLNDIFTNPQSGSAKSLMDFAESLDLIKTNGYPNTVTLISRMRINLNNVLLSSILSVGGRTELTKERFRDTENLIRNLKLEPNDFERALTEGNMDSLLRILGALELLAKEWNQNSHEKVDPGSLYYYHPMQRFIGLIQNRPIPSN